AKGLKGIRIPKLHQRSRLIRQAQAAQQGMRKLPMCLQAGHKIGHLPLSQVTIGPWEAPGLGGAEFHQIKRWGIVRDDQIPLQRWSPPQRVTPKGQFKIEVTSFHVPLVDTSCKSI